MGSVRGSVGTMRLATLRDQTRDGQLVVVDQTGTRWLSAREVAPSLQAALDRWSETAPRLKALARALDSGEQAGRAFETESIAAPLPRAYEWLDGSAFIEHVILVRKARGAAPPETLLTDPLMYQGASGVLLGARDPVPLVDPAFGLDFESEVCVIVDDVPLGVGVEDAASHIKLFVLCNDLTLRNLVPAELAKGFGFLQSKPATAFSPFAITPDELGAHLRDARVHLPLSTWLNGERVGHPDAGAMHFSFAELIAHAARTRALMAGTILGSGTVSNTDASRGVSCLAERRAREMIEHGAARTPFLRVGDRVRIEMQDASGRDLFGAIDQEVVPA